MTINLTWTLEVDWNNDGTFEDDIVSRTFGLKVTRGRKTLISEGRDGGRFTRQDIGTCVLKVDNEDGYFDMLNTGSAIYPNALPGRECRIKVNDGSNTYPVFRGRIDDIAPVGSDFNKTATITVKDGWAALQNKISYGVVQGEDTGSLIGRVLDKAGYIFSNGGGVTVWRFPTRIGVSSYFGPPAWTRNLGTGTDTVDYWWLKDVVAADAINDLAESEFGLFWFGADGVANFLGRHALYNQASLATLPQETFLNTISTRQSLKTMRNTIQVTAYPKVISSAPVVLWKLGQKPLIAAGQSQTFWPAFKFENRTVAAREIISPAASVDYTGNSLADGTGSDMTSALSISATAQAETAEVVVTNTGVVDVYMTSLQVRGTAIDTPYEVVKSSADSDSVDSLGPYVLAADLPWQDDALTAQDFANYLRSWMPSFQPYPLVEIDSRPAVQFAYDLFNRVTLDLDNLNVEQDFRIGGLETEWLTRNGQQVKTTWWCEPVKYAENYWKFSTRIGVTSRFAF